MNIISKSNAIINRKERQCYYTTSVSMYEYILKSLKSRYSDYEFIELNSLLNHDQKSKFMIHLPTLDVVTPRIIITNVTTTNWVSVIYKLPYNSINLINNIRETFEIAECLCRDEIIDWVNNLIVLKRNAFFKTSAQSLLTVYNNYKSEFEKALKLGPTVKHQYLDNFTDYYVRGYRFVNQSKGIFINNSHITIGGIMKNDANAALHYIEQVGLLEKLLQKIEILKLKQL